MALIKQVETGFYRIPLTVTLTDSTHGETRGFELITVRIRDSDGVEGVGYLLRWVETGEPLPIFCGAKFPN